MESNFYGDKPTVFEGSTLSVRSELDLFSLPETNVSQLQSSDYAQFYPLLSVREPNNPIEFIINVGNNCYLDLNDSWLSITARIKKADGTVVPAGELVAPTNLFFQSMFCNLTVHLNGKLIFDSNNNYALLSYFNRVLTTPENIKKTKLRNELYYEDTASTFTSTNKGYSARYPIASASKPFSMLGKLVCGLFQNHRWLPPSSEVKISLRRSPPHFCLDSSLAVVESKPANYVFEIEDATFFAGRRPVSNRIMQLHESLLKKGETFKYILNDPVVRTFNIPAGLSSVTTDSLILGKVPRYIVIGFNKTSALAGNLTEPALYFDHHNIKNVTVHWTGDNQAVRSIPLDFSTTSNTASDSYLLGLNSLYKTMNSETEWNGITRESYKQGQTFVAFELLPQVDGTLVVNRRGSLKCTFDFREALSDSITAVIYCVFQSVLEIDADRQVTVE